MLDAFKWLAKTSPNIADEFSRRLAKQLVRIDKQAERQTKRLVRQIARTEKRQTKKPARVR